MATLNVFNFGPAFPPPLDPLVGLLNGRLSVELLGGFSGEIALDLVPPPAGSSMRFIAGTFDFTFRGTFGVAPDTGLLAGSVTSFDIVQVFGGVTLVAGSGFSASAQAVMNAVLDHDSMALVSLLYGGGDVLTAAGLNRFANLAGGAGNDTIIGGNAASNLFGDAGNDHITGGNAFAGQARSALATGDLIEGGDGNDTILGLAGNDSLTGGAGDDSILAGLDADSVQGGDGNDVLLGGDGNDSIWAGDGADTLLGEVGNDFMRGEGGRDSLDGGSGNDTLAGNEDRDTLSGGEGNDVLYGDIATATSFGADSLSGGAGADTLFGYAGADTLLGGEGHDRLLGGAGNDVLVGGTGGDVLVGGTGADRFVWRSLADGGSNVMRDFISDFSRAQGDRIDVSGIDASTRRGATGDQAFQFIDAAPFVLGQAARLRVEVADGFAFVEMETNGDAVADLLLEVSLALMPSGTLVASDFIL